MKKKIVTLMLATALSTTVLTGCAFSITPVGFKRNVDSSVNTEQQAEDIQDFSDTSDKKSDTSDKKSNKGSSTLDTSQMINIDNMQFKLEGHVFTLGETTLQDMLDAGIEFDKDSMSNASNNVNADNEILMYYKVGKYNTAYLSFTNFTEDNLKATDCTLSSIDVSIFEDSDDDYSKLEFTIPYGISTDELISQAGEPTDTYTSESSNFTTLYYQRESEQYYGDLGYSISFMDNQLSGIEMEFLP